MSLGLRVMAAIVLLGAVLGVKLALDAAASWRAERHDETMLVLNAHSTPLLDAAGALAAERGLTNGMLANAAATDAAVRSEIGGLRGKADASRARALGGLATLPALSGAAIAQAIADEAAAAARLGALRADIDQAWNASVAVPPSQATWFAAATTEIDALTRLRRLIEAASAQDPALSQLVMVRDALAEMSEFGGRERGRINGAIAGNARLSAAEMAQLGALRGRLEGAWTRVEAATEHLPPLLADAVRSAGSSVFETFQRTRGPVMPLPPAPTGRFRPPPGSARPARRSHRCSRRDSRPARRSTSRSRRARRPPTPGLASHWHSSPRHSASCWPRCATCSAASCARSPRRWTR